METKFPTHDQIRETFASVRALVQRSKLCLDATIDDYPIGRRERGKCCLQVERAKNKGYRTVRTTTDRYGRWCTPKKSTFRPDVMVVVKNIDAQHQAAWLGVGLASYAWSKQHAYLTYANGKSTPLLECWRAGEPRRETERHTLVFREASIDITYGGVTATPDPTEDRQEILYEADSPAECDAWELWVEELETVRQLLLDVWKEAGVLARGYF